MDGDMMGMLRQVMDNPQFGEMVRAMKAQMGEGDADPAKMMEKLPEMMAMLGPMMGGAGQAGGAEKGNEPSAEAPGDTAEKQQAEKQTEPDKETVQSAQPVGAMFFRPGSREKRNKLLAALKPYLSPARCALVDRAMSAMQLGEILGTMSPSGQRE